MNVNENMGYTFDDVLLVPQHSDIETRKSIDVSARITKNKSIDIPIVAANMDTITTASMMIKMAELGGLGVLHRFMTQEKTLAELQSFIHNDKYRDDLIAFSVGVNDDYSQILDFLYDAGLYEKSIVFIDIAHGDCDRVVNLIKSIRKTYRKRFDIVAGNVATASATKRLIKAGATGIKVGIGPGSMCTTRLVTGHGLPQLTAVAECAAVSSRYKVPIIADGGIRKSGDIVKALAAGADCVMVGSLLAGCSETPGKPIRDKGKYFKVYRGMASRDAMMGWKKDENTTPEGISITVPKRGSVEKVVDDLLGGVRSGLSYSGAHCISELHRKAQFQVVSSATVIENKAHRKE